MKRITKAVRIALSGSMVLGLVSGAAPATGNEECSEVPTYAQLKAAVDDASTGATSIVLNGGFGLNMWAAVVNRDGFICAVAFSGVKRDDQWPASCVIAAQSDLSVSLPPAP